MANTKKYISLDKLEKYNDLIKGVISDGDAASLKSAKDYADSLAGNYDAAGAAATAESNAKAYAKEYADGLAGNYDAAGSAAAVDAKLTTEVARAKAAEEANTALINAIKDGAELDSFKDVEEKLAGYQVSGDYAVNGHKHVMADITDLAAALDLKADKSALEDEVKRAEGIEAGLQSAIDTINNEESGILAQAKAYTDTSYETAMNAVQNTFKDVIADHAADIKAINDKIGTVDEDSTVVGMIEAVDAKTDKNAEDIVTINETIKNIQENAYDDTEIRGLISDNASAIEALEGTHSTDKAALEGAIALKADATALEAEVKRAQEAEKANADEITRIDNALKLVIENEDETALNSIKELATWVNEHGEDAAEMVGNISQNASDIDALEGRMDTAEGALATVDSRIEAAITGADLGKYALDADLDALEGRVDVLEAAKEEHAGLLAGLRTDVDAKAAQADLEALDDRVEDVETKLATIEEGAEVNVIEVVKVNGEALTVTDKAVDIVVPVGGLAGKDEVSEDELSETLAAKINGKAEQSALEAAVEVLEGADSALDERLQLVEAQLGDGENSVADLIATAKQEAIDDAAEAADTKDAAILAEAKADSSNKDAVVLAEAQKGIDAVQAALDAHIAEANAVAGRVATAEGEIDTLQLEMDAVEALVAANKAAHEANATAIALKASQADLEAVSGRVTTLETWHTNFVEASEEDINALFA